MKGSPWDYGYIRSTPCDNHSPIDTVYSGDVVYILGHTQQSCGYQYIQVVDVKVDKIGWMSTEFLDCHPPLPASIIPAATKN